MDLFAAIVVVFFSNTPSVSCCPRSFTIIAYCVKFALSGALAFLARMRAGVWNRSFFIACRAGIPMLLDVLAWEYVPIQPKQQPVKAGAAAGESKESKEVKTIEIRPVAAAADDEKDAQAQAQKNVPTKCQFVDQDAADRRWEVFTVRAWSP